MKSMKEYREEKNLTQEQMANLIGLSQETVSQYENGTRTPNVITAKKIAKVLEKPLDSIFFGKNISN